MLPLIPPTDANLARAKELHLARGASLWDALILAACVEAGVEIFYSEDLPGFDDFDGVRVVNPFKSPSSEGAEEGDTCPGRGWPLTDPRIRPRVRSRSNAWSEPGLLPGAQPSPHFANACSRTCGFGICRPRRRRRTSTTSLGLPGIAASLRSVWALRTFRQCRARRCAARERGSSGHSLRFGRRIRAATWRRKLKRARGSSVLAQSSTAVTP